MGLLACVVLKHASSQSPFTASFEFDHYICLIFLLFLFSVILSHLITKLPLLRSHPTSVWAPARAGTTPRWTPTARSTYATSTAWTTNAFLIYLGQCAEKRQSVALTIQRLSLFPHRHRRHSRHHPKNRFRRRRRYGSSGVFVVVGGRTLSRSRAAVRCYWKRTIYMMHIQKINK